MRLTFRLKGGPGSGHRGHVGRPGMVGGSAPGIGGVPLGGLVTTSALGSARMAAVKHANRDIVGTARRLDMTTEDVKARIVERLDEDLAQPISIMAGMNGAMAMVQEGRFKTQYETGTSGGMFDPTYREYAEKIGLGVSDVDVISRPVYGYFNAGDPAVDGYGTVEFVLKDSVKARATYTVGDSLEGFSGGYQVGGKRSADVAAWGGNLDNYVKYGVSDKPFRGVGTRWPDYIEAQIHGGVSLKDVAKVVIHVRPDSPMERYEYDPLRDRLKSKGIKVEYV